MKPILRCLLILLGMIPGSPAGEPLVVGERTRIHAPTLGEDRDILVSVPASYPRSTRPFPVLYVLDGDSHFLQLRGMLDFLARTGLAPEVILVAIPNTHRNRDLTPTRGFILRPEGTRMELRGTGGGDAFLDFIEKNLIPWVERTYRTLPFRILAGHSLGGTLALHTVATRSHLFKACLAVSPALHWDGGYPARALEARLEGPGPVPVSLFVTMGDEETSGMYPPPARFRQLKSILRKPVAGFRAEAREFPAENHATVVFESHYWGLRWVFEGWKIPWDGYRGVPDQPVRVLREHFAKVSAQAGCPVVPPEGWCNAVGYQLLELGRTSEAVQVFRYNLELYPSSPNAHDSLGEGLERAGETGEALAAYEQAVRLGQLSGDPNGGAFKAHAGRLKDRLGKRP